jgi:hypothetical protein
MDFLPRAKTIVALLNNFGRERMPSANDKLVAPLPPLHEARCLHNKEWALVLPLVTRIGDGEVIADLQRGKQTIKTARLTGTTRITRSSPERVALDTTVREKRRSVRGICRRGPIFGAAISDKRIV